MAIVWVMAQLPLSGFTKVIIARSRRSGSSPAKRRRWRARRAGGGKARSHAPPPCPLHHASHGPPPPRMRGRNLRTLSAPRRFLCALLCKAGSIRRPFLVRPADCFPEAAGVLRPIAFVGAGRLGFADRLGPTAEPEGMVGPVAGRRASVAQPFFEFLLQRCRIGPFGGGCAGVAGDRGKHAQLAAQRDKREHEPDTLHPSMLSRMTGCGPLSKSGLPGALVYHIPWACSRVARDRFRSSTFRGWTPAPALPRRRMPR